MSDANNLLNLSTINELKEILDDSISEIYIDFNDDMLEMLKDIKQAVADENTSSIIHIAHTIKGASGNIGLEKIATLSSQIESGLRSGKAIDTAQLITDIERAFNETQAALILMELLPA